MIKTRENWFKYLPNYLSLLRILIVPILMVLLPLNLQSIDFFCAGLFVIASITDLLDGYIARAYNLESKIGAILDPIADKLLTTTALILLVELNRLWGWVVVLFLCRDLSISGLRLMALQNSLVIKVSWLGKLKTILLDIAITCLIVNSPLFNLPFKEVGMISLWSALSVSLLSAFLYIKKYLKLADI